jgi:hypothetical protein
MKHVSLHIDRLVLNGFRPEDRCVIAGAIERELGALIAARGLPVALAQPGEHPRINAGQCRVASGDPAQTLGAQVAATLYGGLTR